MAGHRIEATRPRWVTSPTSESNDAGVRPLASFRLQVTSPMLIGASQSKRIELVNRIEAAAKGEFNPETQRYTEAGQALSDQCTLLGWAFEKMTGGAMLGDSPEAETPPSLDEIATAITNHMDDTEGVMPETVRADMRVLSDAVIAQIADRKAYLSQAVNDSPFSVEKMYQGKALMCDAASLAIARELERPDLKPEQRRVLQQAQGVFATRADQLREDASANKDEFAKPKDILGKKPPTINSLKGFFKVIGNAFASLIHATPWERHATELLQKGRIASATPEIDEQSIIEAALKKTFKGVGIDDKRVHRGFRVAMNKVLNSQKWNPISRDLRLQYGPDSVMVTSEILPAAVAFDSYKGGGFNCHSTAEYRHAANLAQTRLIDKQGNTLFSGMRHGVVCAYGITSAELKQMNDSEAGAMITELLPAAAWVRDDAGGLDIAATRECLTKTGVTRTTVALMEDNQVDDLIERLLPRDAWQQNDKGEPDLDATRARVRRNGIETSDLVSGMRRQANKNRASEIVAAQVMADGALLRAALNHEPVTLDLLSVSLLTPDQWRGGDANEWLMLKEQEQAWMDVSGLCSVTVKHPETENEVNVTVDVRPMQVNYGVNQGAVGTVSAGPGASGWEDVAEMNDAALETLLGSNPEQLARGGKAGGMIGGRMAALERSIETDENAIRLMDPKSSEAVSRCAKVAATKKKLDHAKELVSQIGEMVRDGSFKHQGQEPYKMPVRMAVLADMFGIKVAFNCKSGKDRTGEMDSEVKFMRMEMEATGHVPHFRRHRSQGEVNRLRQFVFDGGNFPFQILNTTFAGYKLKGLDAVTNQIGGGKTIVERFLGNSDFTEK